MKKINFLLVLFVAAAMSSCKLAIIPTAVNTVNSVGLQELNLQRNDYNVLKTISAEAVVNYSQHGRKIEMTEANKEFQMTLKRPMFSPTYLFKKFNGVARYGFLANDYAGRMESIKGMSAEEIARNLAIYRLINACKVAGGDGVIEPIITMSIDQVGGRALVIKVNATAKVVKLKTDK